MLRGGLLAGACVALASLANLCHYWGTGQILAFLILVTCVYRKEEPTTGFWAKLMLCIKGVLIGMGSAFLFCISYSLFSVGLLAFRDPVDGLFLLKFLTSVGLASVVVLTAVFANTILPRRAHICRLATALVLMTGLITGLYLNAVAFWYTELRDFAEIDFVRFTERGQLLYQVDQRQGGMDLDRLCRLDYETGEHEVFPGYWSELRRKARRIDLRGDWAALKDGLTNLKSGEIAPYKGVGGRARVSFLKELPGYLVFSNGHLAWHRPSDILDIDECTRFLGATDTRAVYFRAEEGTFSYNFETRTAVKLSDKYVSNFNSDWAIVEEDGWVQAVALDGSGSKRVYEKPEGREVEIELSPIDNRLILCEMDERFTEDMSPEIALYFDLETGRQQRVDLPTEEFDGREFTWLPSERLCLSNDYGQVYLAEGAYRVWKELPFRAASSLSVNPLAEEFVVRTLNNSLLVVDFEGEILRTYSREDLI